MNKESHTRSTRYKTPMLYSIAFSILLVLTFSCEKRIPLEAEFPYEEGRLFCEVLGISEQGFLCTIAPVQAIQATTSLPARYDLIIEEDGLTIFELHSDQSSFFLPYQMSSDKDYTLHIEYKGQDIYSQPTRMPAKIQLTNLEAGNDFIDSLGFYVASYAFDAEPTAPAEPEQYFAFTSQLVFTPAVTIDWFDIEEGIRIENGATQHIQQRIPNQNNYQYLKAGLLALDKHLYQYLKNIKKPGIIPNDHIAGHHGNLTGAIGYFGLVNYELEEVAF